MGIKISDMTLTGSAPADSYIPLAHNGENYKVTPSNVGGFAGAGEFLGRVDYFRASYPNIYTNNIGASLPSLSELIVPEGVINWGPVNMEFKNVTNNTYVIEGVQYVAHSTGGELAVGSVDYQHYYKTLSLILAPQTQLTVFRPPVASSMWSVNASGGVSSYPKAGAQSWYIYNRKSRQKVLF